MLMVALRWYAVDTSELLSTDEQAFPLDPVTFDLFNVIKKFDSLNYVIFERRRLSRTRKIECQNKTKQ
jgi:hypothetical protein